MLIFGQLHFKSSGLKKITIYDIAKALDLNVSTVSRALNNSPRVKPQTKLAVNKMASELGYEPNQVAVNLRKSKSNTIGAIVPRINRHYFSEAIGGIEDTAFKAGYSVIICQSLEELEREMKHAQSLFASRIDGLIMSISMETNNCAHLSRYIDKKMPLVFFDRIPPDSPVTNVVIDDYAISKKATEHLIKGGCQRIAILCGPLNLNIYQDRLRGYKDALSDGNIPFDEEIVLFSSLLKQDGVAGARKLLELSQPIDGVFSTNDTAGIAAMQYFLSKGKKIPDDISIIGFSNEPVSSAISPGLSTVDQPGFKIGALSTKILLDIINGTSDYIEHPSTIVLNSELLIRESTRSVVQALS